MKKEKGSVTLFVLISCMFMIIILLVVNIGVMNKNRSQEKELEEISKQYNHNETDLDNTYDETVDNEGYIKKSEVEELINKKIEEERNNNYYKPGDTYKTTVTTGGYVTNLGTEYTANIFLDKLISDEVKSVTINSVTGGVCIRQNGNYLLDTTSYENPYSGFTVELTLRSGFDNSMGLKIIVPEKNSKVENNSSIGIALEGLNITFE